MKYLSFTFYFILICLGCASIWVYTCFGDISVQQMIINLAQINDVMPHIVINFALWVILPSFILSLLPSKIKNILSVLSVAAVVYVFNLISFITNQNVYSSLFEDDFVRIDTQKIKFPLKKQNLIVIYVESLEKQYRNDKYVNEILTPYLQKQKALSFDGFYQLPSIKYTLAGLLASQCGFKENYNLDNMDSFYFFFPQLSCISDILAANGYKNFFYKSSDLKFANTIFFTQQHNFHVTKGLDAWKKENPNNSLIFGNSWGIRDSFLYEQIKKTIVKMQQINQPFSIFAVTVNTHGEENYIDPNCPINKFSLQNSIKCADFLLQDFIEWCKNQPFYNNMTLVIIGDHLAHGQKNHIYINAPKQRSIENIFLNSQRQDKKKHQWTTFDLAPTIMEALGYNMPSLGLGRSLFNTKQTLFEKYGSKLDTMIEQNSRFLDNLRQNVTLQKLKNKLYLPINDNILFQKPDELKSLIPYSDLADFSLGRLWLRQLNLKMDHPQNINLVFEAATLYSLMDRTFLVLANGKKIGEITFNHKIIGNQSFALNLNQEDFQNNLLSLEFVNNDSHHWSLMRQGIGFSKIQFIIK